MATIRDVAARAGVSVGTVSRVLAGSPATSAQSRQRVAAAVTELGYLPNAPREQLYLHTFSAQRVDGVLMTPQSPDRVHLDRLLAAGLPIVSRRRARVGVDRGRVTGRVPPAPRRPPLLADRRSTTERTSG